MDLTGRFNDMTQDIELRNETDWAERLSICRQTLRRARKRGDLAYYRVGDRVLISAEQIAAFLERNERKVRERAR
jgi:excisionase family DNA binding protein